MSFESLLNTSVTILSRTSTTNELGEKIHSWASKGETSTRIVPITIEERLILPGEYQNARYKAYFPSSTSISEKDRIVWNDNVYEVVGVYLDSSFHHKTVILREVES